jgi:hypothetical protein
MGVCRPELDRNLHDPPWLSADQHLAVHPQLPRAIADKKAAKIGFFIKNQLLKLCDFRIAATQHYCF